MSSSSFISIETLTSMTLRKKFIFLLVPVDFLLGDVSQSEMITANIKPAVSVPNKRP